MAAELLKQYSRGRAYVLYSIDPLKLEQIPDFVGSLLKQGYVRLQAGWQFLNLNTDPLPKKFDQMAFYVVVDRLEFQKDNRTRLVESLETAFQEGHGVTRVQIVGHQALNYSTILRCPNCERTFDPVRPVLFSFNHTLGACPECKGFGNILRYDEDLIVLD